MRSEVYEKMKKIDIGDRLNALREEWVNNTNPSHEELLEYDLGLKFIIAAALVELVIIGRENQEKDETNGSNE